ncbi:MAG: hypothetical protein J6N54_10490 [Bacteroidales bacterium]|nr:hypothetical protein [Bacteroidales bacterium]
MEDKRYYQGEKHDPRLEEGYDVRRGKYRHFQFIEPYVGTRDGDNYDLYDEWGW